MISAGKQTIAILWDKGPLTGTIEIVNGRLDSMRITTGKGTVNDRAFAISSGTQIRMEITLVDAKTGPGPNPTLVQIQSEKSPVTVILRDVAAKTPVYIPEYGVIVTDANDKRSFSLLSKAIKAKKLKSGLQKIAHEPEETFDNAASRNRNMPSPVWLGTGRDMRIFRLGHDENFGYWGYVQPAYQSYVATLPELGGKEYGLNFVVGPGSSCAVNITRRLEDGVLPIVHSEQVEQDVTYRLTAFATLETRPLGPNAVRGSDWRATYAKTLGNMCTKEELEADRDLIAKETTGREEEMVCCIRVEAVNNGKVPRYAWFKTLVVNPGHGSLPHNIAEMNQKKSFDPATGFASIGPGRIYGIHRLNGKPMPDEEAALLIQPGASAVFEMIIPHQPVSETRAVKLEGLDINRHLDACRAFWRAKLNAGARISVPEKGIDERIRAGLLHLDINTFGMEPDGPALACVGWYSPIGSESSPMIQFYDSMGWHNLARRCLDYFLARQRDDGFIQNFGGYQLETGPFLWTVGEHWRYTRDNAWVDANKTKILKSCAFILAWRNRNKREELRGMGYGLLDGKVADPEDFFHSFMLNALSYVGLVRIAEMLAATDPAQSRRLAEESAAFREDIRTSYYESLARSPAIPLGDGAWAPAPPPWSDYRGPLALFTEGGKWFTHGGFGTRDSLIGSLYLVIAEVLDARETGATFLLKTHHELFTKSNTGVSQPYYCRHDFIHLKRGEVKEYLKTYYNQLAALQDRETYTFWEHYFHASQHKTHEEAWFLMQTRWMLFCEEGDTLALMSAIPRVWMKKGKTVVLENVRTHFGTVSAAVKSNVDKGFIEASVSCAPGRIPKSVTIRLPHPDGKKGKKVTGGIYDPKTETVTIADFTGKTRVKLWF